MKMLKVMMVLATIAAAQSSLAAYSPASSTNVSNALATTKPTAPANEVGGCPMAKGSHARIGDITVAQGETATKATVTSGRAGADGTYKK